MIAFGRRGGSSRRVGGSIDGVGAAVPASVGGRGGTNAIDVIVVGEADAGDGADAEDVADVEDVVDMAVAADVASASDAIDVADTVDCTDVVDVSPP